MKPFLVSAAVAALILAAPAAFADPPDNNNHHGGKPSSGHDDNHGKAPHNTSSPNGSSHMSGAHNSQASPMNAPGHGMTTTTASPAATFNNNAGMKSSGHHRKDDSRNGHNNTRNDHNWNSRGNNRSGVNVHINFNRRNVTAQHHYRYRGNAWRWPNGYRYQRWTFGMTLPSVFWARNYWISDYEDYGLGVPPPGTVWVRYNDDAILIDQYTGEILEVVYGQFY